MQQAAVGSLPCSMQMCKHKACHLFTGQTGCHPDQHQPAPTLLPMLTTSGALREPDAVQHAGCTFMGFVTIWVTTSMTSASAPLPRKACRLCAREAELLVSISMPCGERAGRTVRQSDATAREAEVLVSSSMPCTGRAGIFRSHRVALWYHKQWGRRLWSSSKGSLGYLNALQGKSASALPLSCCGGHWQLCALLVEACNWAAHGLSRRSVQHGSRLLTL